MHEYVEKYREFNDLWNLISRGGVVDKYRLVIPSMVDRVIQWTNQHWNWNTHWNLFNNVNEYIIHQLLELFDDEIIVNTFVKTFEDSKDLDKKVLYRYIFEIKMLLQRYKFKQTINIDLIRFNFMRLSYLHINDIDQQWNIKLWDENFPLIWIFCLILKDNIDYTVYDDFK